MNRFVLVFIALLTLYTPVYANNCNKGKPCGNTCINRNYTCHVGTGSSSSSNSTSTSYRPTSSGSTPASQTSTNEVVSNTALENLRGPTPVIAIVDGDTVTLEVNGVVENVRLIGIDTPETKHPTIGVEPFGPEASAFTETLLAGQNVYVEFDVELRDHYGRPLVYLYLEDSGGVWTYAGKRLSQVNMLIAASGFADVLTMAPNVKYAERFVNAVQKAREAKRGMWANYVAETPTTTFTTFQGDHDCSHFVSHAQAQAFFEAHGPGDPHKLDSDGDGLACESLP
jgi:micrococcal nuclease